MGIKERGRSGSSRDSNPAGLCCSSTHYVQCASYEASSFTNPNLGPDTYARLWLELERDNQRELSPNVIFWEYSIVILAFYNLCNFVHAFVYAIFFLSFSNEFWGMNKPEFWDPVAENLNCITMYMDITPYHAHVFLSGKRVLRKG